MHGKFAWSYSARWASEFDWEVAFETGAQRRCFLPISETYKAVRADCSAPTLPPLPTFTWRATLQSPHTPVIMANKRWRKCRDYVRTYQHRSFLFKEHILLKVLNEQFWLNATNS